MADEPSPSETIDPNGVRVVLTGVVWSGKIVRDHKEIATYRADVLRAVSAPNHAVSAPNHVAPDPDFRERTRYYARSVGPRS